MIFDELCGAKGATKGPQMDHFSAKRRRKTHQEIIRKSVSKKLKFWCQNDANIGAKYNNKWCKQTAAKHVSKTIKKHKNKCFWSFRQLDVRPWKSTKILPKTYRRPCKIDDKSVQNRCSKQSCKKHGKWCQHGAKMEIPSNKHETTIQKNITKNDAKMKRPKAMRPEGSLGPECQ